MKSKEFKSFEENLIGPVHDPGERRRLYVLVIHGTILGQAASSWYKRSVPDDEYPFCRELSEQMRMLGVAFPVWANCEELDMEEFSWSGLNTHMERLRAGRSLASYINECHEKCVNRFDEQPAFALIGHSHGGNVILSCLGLLRPEIALASIHLMGTPFFLFDDTTRLWRNGDRNTRSLNNHRNIYLSGAPTCPIQSFVGTFGDEMDEVHSMFAFLRTRSYFRLMVAALARKLATRPAPLQILTIPVVDRKFSIFGSTLAGAGFLTSTGTYPDLRQRTMMRLRHLLAWTSWPFRWAAIRLLSPVAERAFERSVFRFVTGLDPNHFPPDRLLITPAFGFTPDRYITEFVNIPESIRLGDSVRLSKYLGGGEVGRADAEQLAVASLILRADELMASFKLMHTAYYRSKYIMQRIAFNIIEDALNHYRFRKLCTLSTSTVKDGKYRTSVRTAGGDLVEYEFDIYEQGLQ